jgi:hypothetical protein
LPIFLSPEARPSQSAANHTDHLALFNLGVGLGRSITKAKGGLMHIFMAVDKFTKWIKAKLATSIIAANAVEFV